MTRTAQISQEELQALTEVIIDRGIDADHHALLALARTARTLGSSEDVIGLLLDPTEPAIARERAFAVLARRVANADSASAIPVATQPTRVALEV